MNRKRTPPSKDAAGKSEGFGLKPAVPSDLQLVSLADRPGKVSIDDFARVWNQEDSLLDFVEGLPGVLAARDFRDFIARLRAARRQGRPRILAMGAHVIKVGLNPVLIDLMEQGWITALALNGACVIHDFEIAFSGRTSEDVAAGLGSGRFGMAEETGENINQAIRAGAARGIGFGEAAAEMVHDSGFPYASSSLLAAAWALKIPVTVHVAIGTDTIHFHPGADGAALGRTALHDFRLFCSLVGELDGGGVFINAGSAVLLPEVFLKAVTVLRNQGTALRDFSTAVFDFNDHYRPRQNVVTRPVEGSGKGFYFIGHHEIMLPLLAAALKSG